LVKAEWADSPRGQGSLMVAQRRQQIKSSKSVGVLVKTEWGSGLGFKV